MNKITFKRRLQDTIRRCKSVVTSINDVRAINSVLASSGRLPSVFIETFMRHLKGYDESSFSQPRAEHEALRNLTVDKMSRDGIFRFDYKLAQKATDYCAKQLNLTGKQFSAYSTRQAADTLPTNTSTGFPWFRPKGEMKEEAIRLVDSVIARGDFDWFYQTLACVIAWRTQERQSGTKFRQIFVLNYWFNIIEAMFAGPLYAHFRTNRSTCYSFDSVYNDNRKVWLDLQKYKYTIGLDYSKFDINVSMGLLFWFFQFIKRMFKMPYAVARLFDAVVVGNLSCNVYTQYKGKPFVFAKRSGVLSGSVFTNMIDSFINLFMINYVLLEQGLNPDDFYIKVKGDDTLIGTNLTLDPRIFSKRLRVLCGAQINLKDTLVFKPGERIYFLGYRFDDKSKLPLSEELLDRKIAISGRFISEEDMPESLRVISKVVSVLSNVSNGYNIFMKHYHKQLLSYYNLSELPKYYYDLAETEVQSYSLENIKSIWHELKYGWRYR